MDEFWDLLIRSESRLDNMLNVVRPLRAGIRLDEVSREDVRALALHLESLKKYVLRLGEILDV